MHALTYEVAYGSLPQERRRALHARIVEVLEGLYADRLAEHVDRLAHHAWRGEVWDKALSYCRQAGTRAMAHSAYREAVAYLEQALAALAHLPECRDTLAQAIDLRVDLRNALLPLGEQPRLFDQLRAAEALAEQLGDDQRLSLIASDLCIYFSNIGEHDHAIAAGQRALVLAEELGMRPLLAHCHLGLGTLYAQGGRRELARAALSTAITLFRMLEMTFWLPRAEAALAQVEE